MRLRAWGAERREPRCDEPAGDVYEGPYVLGEREGHGTLKRADGGFYEGEFRMGLVEGVGKYTIKSSGQVEEREYRAGELVAVAPELDLARRRRSHM